MKVGDNVLNYNQFYWKLLLIDDSASIKCELIYF